MTFALVRHQVNPEREFWFEVARDLQYCIHVGDEVLCDTVKGLARGRVEKIIVGFSDDEFMEQYGFYPSADIIGMYTNCISPDVIRVPKYLSDSRPGVDKIKKRISEFYSKGGFKTKIEVDTNLTLKDGYTAYLVAKMFGVDTLQNCLISVGAESVYKTVLGRRRSDND